MATPFWHLRHLSDVQLLERLQSVSRTKRRALAELIAHLGEVEERRLHLQAACGSLFSYCVHRLGMSEDGACQRIEVARLARRFPALFLELAGGGITLPVALLLKRVLSPENHLELFAALRGASTERARELLAERFPSPDVPSGIRKLPERRNPASQPASSTPPAQGMASVAAPERPFAPSSQTSPATPPTAASPARELLSNEMPSHEVAQPNPPPSSTTRQPERSRLQQRIEPLSAGRYRVQFTADASLKRKLEQAPDLLRHAQPDGDLGAIVSRALDLLLDEVMRRRFGTRKRRVAAQAAASATPPAAAPARVAAVSCAPTAATPTATPTTSANAPSITTTAPPTTATAPPITARPTTVTTAPPPAPHGVGGGAPSRIARAARRAVLERDGLGCSWVDAEGRRCGSTAWLEHDHRHLAGKGGGSDPDNLRMLCRSHNRFAAERAYGRAHLEHAMRARQRAAPP